MLPLRNNLVKSAYLLSPQCEPISHVAACLVQGLISRGIAIRSNVNFDEIVSSDISKPFKIRSDLNNIELSTNSKNEDIYIVDIPSSPFDWSSISRNCFSSKPVVFINNKDTANYYDYHESILVFSTHCNKFARRKGDIRPIGFGLSQGIIERSESFDLRGQRSRIVNNFNKTFNQDVRLSLELALINNLEKVMQLDRRHLTGNDYENQLCQSAGVLCYGGSYATNVLDYAYWRETWKDNPDKLAELTFQAFERECVIFRWDSWRFWETAAFGCVPFQLDFEKYGFALPSMPIPWVHYVPIDLDDISNLPSIIKTKLESDPGLFAKIGKQAREWAIVNYSPSALAEYVLAEINSKYFLAEDSRQFCSSWHPKADSPVSMLSFSGQDDGCNEAVIEIVWEIYSQGMALLQAGKLHGACIQFRKAVNMAPGFSDAAISLGYCLHLLGKYGEAVSVYDAALGSTPTLVAAWNNRGNALLELCHYADAAESYSRALELAPELHDTRVALATCYQALGLVKKAMNACEAVLKAAPGHAEAHWNKALLLLLEGDYRDGWREYEWRWRKRNFTSPLRDFSQPRWQGESVDGKTILVHAEQGFGDTLQFCRYIPLVAALGARVVFECHPPLAALMESLAGGNMSVVAMGDPPPPFDLQVPLMSLPMIFGTTVETIPCDVPYLAPPSERLSFWQSQIIDNGCFKIGLCWAGKRNPDPGRSCPAELLASLAEIPGVSWYSLQVGWGDDLPLAMSDLTAHIRDFGDTAALVAQFDLIITVDTAVAHLAGALGKPTWVMLPQAPDWRWMLVREDSPWYPTMRLFRQREAGAWAEVVRRVGEALGDEVPRRC